MISYNEQKDSGNNSCNCNFTRNVTIVPPLHLLQTSHFQVFHPLLKMCVLPEEMPCSKGTKESGNSNKHTFEKKDIESPNTAPDAAAAILSFLHNPGNLNHQTVHTTTSTNTESPLQFSTRPSYVLSTNSQAILPHEIMHQVRFLNRFMVSKC
jgi:hypothetical protein